MQIAKQILPIAVSLREICVQRRKGRCNICMDSNSIIIADFVFMCNYPLEALDTWPRIVPPLRQIVFEQRSTHLSCTR